MSSAFGIDGLASGLDTTSIINSLMQIEAGPQTILKRTQSTAQNVVTALQGINARLTSLTSAAEKAVTADNWKAYSATSSSTSVAAATTTAAQGGSLTFSIEAVATRQVSLSAAVTDGAALATDNPPTLTLKKANGDLVSITAASNSLSDMATAINESGMGITATAVRVSSGSPATYRLQFTAGATGTDGAFELYVGDQAAVNGATAMRIDASPATIATDAQITLWKGTGSEQVFAQSSNTFTGLMTGVDISVSEPTGVGETVTVNVAADATKVADLAKNLVGSLTLVLSDIDSRTASVTSPNSNGGTKVTGGLLTGDSGVRAIRQQLVNAASYPVDGVSPSSVGIVIGRDGGITFDADKFAAAVEQDPAGTAEFVQAIATRLQAVADSMSDPYEGSLTSRITSQESLVEDYTQQIENWDTRLELRRSTLRATYSALEVTLSGLNAQSSWLSGQLSSLSSNNYR